MKTWLGVLTAVVALLAAGVIAGLSALNADVARLEDQVARQLETRVSTPLPPGRAPSQAALEAQVIGIAASTDTLTVTLRVRFAGTADLLAEPPVLRTGRGQIYAITPDSLGQARFAFLDLATRGEAQFPFIFEGSPDPGDPLWLIFNPNHREDDVLAPRREVRIR